MRGAIFPAILFVWHSAFSSNRRACASCVQSSSAEAPRYAEELRAEIILVDIISSAADHSADAADAAVA